MTTTITTPDRSLEQRLAALQQANYIRSRRARLKRDLKAGRADLAPLLLEPPSWLETAKVTDLLLTLPKYGRVKTTKILRHLAIAPSKTVGGLSRRQRAALVATLRDGG